MQIVDHEFLNSDLPFIIEKDVVTNGGFIAKVPREFVLFQKTRSWLTDRAEALKQVKRLASGLARRLVNESVIEGVQN